MPADIVAAVPHVHAPRIAFPIAWLPALLILALAAFHLAASLHYPEVAAAIDGVVGP